MSHLPSPDSELAALRSTHEPGSQSFDQAEALDLSSRDRIRRGSLPESFTSEVTSGTGSQSVYADAGEGGSAAGRSETTITRSEAGEGSMTDFSDARETLSRAGDSGSVLLSDSEPAPTPTIIAPAPLLADVTPTGTVRGPQASYNDTTPKALQTTFSTLSPPLTLAHSLGSSQDESETRYPTASEKPSKEGGEPSGKSTPTSHAVDFEDPELSHLTTEQRRAIMDQV